MGLLALCNLAVSYIWNNRDNSNLPKLEKRYTIVPSLHLHQLDYKAKCVSKIFGYKTLGKIQVALFLKVEEINQGKMDNIHFQDKIVQVKESETK